MPLILSIYRLLTALAHPLASYALKQRLHRGKEDPARWRERLGYTDLNRAQGNLVWLHGASVGECLSLLPLAERYHDAGHTVLLTSGTIASAQLLAQRLKPGMVHQFVPVDTPQAVARFLDHWQPDTAIFAESEWWPNLLSAAHGRGVKLALVSARISDATQQGWAKHPKAVRYILNLFTTILAQDEATATRLTALGRAPDGIANLKLAGVGLPADPQTLDEMRSAIGNRPVILAASTHPGEDEIVLDAFARLQSRHPLALLIIAPRHVTRGDAITALARSQSNHVAQRSKGEAITAHTGIYIADTLGEMGVWYRLARAALVGGSLVPDIGGHNPLEPARLDCPVLTGPHVANFEIYEALFAHEAALCVADAAELLRAADQACKGQLLPMAERARRLVSSTDTALETCWSHLMGAA